MPSNFDLKGMCQAVQAGRLEWQRHVLERMAQRDISQQDVLKILLNGQIIEDYPSDWPFPSALILGWRGKNPLHAVVSFNKTSRQAFIITVYEPGLEYFESDFKTRRKN